MKRVTAFLSFVSLIYQFAGIVAGTLFTEEYEYHHIPAATNIPIE
jgi:hypothetical protein